jgi:transposase-like protein
MAKRKRRAFTKEFKAEAVRVVQASGKTVGAVARELDLTEKTLGDADPRPERTMCV